MINNEAFRACFWEHVKSWKRTRSVWQKMMPVSRTRFTQGTKVTSMPRVTLCWHTTCPKPCGTSFSKLPNTFWAEQFSGHQPVHQNRRKPAMSAVARRCAANLHSSSFSAYNCTWQRGRKEKCPFKVCWRDIWPHKYTGFPSLPFMSILDVLKQTNKQWSEKVPGRRRHQPQVAKPP